MLQCPKGRGADSRSSHAAATASARGDEHDGYRRERHGWRRQCRRNRSRHPHDLRV